MSLKDKALLTDEELDDCYFNPPTTLANEFKDYREVSRHIAETQHKKTVQTILQSLSDIKPLGEEKILDAYYDNLGIGGVQHNDGCRAIAQAALEDYNRQIKEKFNG